MDGRAVSPGTDAWIPDGHLSYRAGIDGVECSLTYTSWKGEPALRITLTNRGHVPFQPVKAGLRLGIDTYMDTYPEWFGKYFPTLMRNEKTHFTGYLQTLSGHTLGLVCPQPVASWSVEYNLGYQDPAPHWFMGHRIESLNIDLLNALPLPSRNPQDLWCLRQGESRSWTIVLIYIEAPGQFEAELSSIADIPMIRMERTGYGAGETAVFDVLGDSPQVIVTDDSGRQMDLTVGKVPGAEGEMTFEDGMISCSALQIGMLALLQEDTAARKHYTRAMLDILRSHDCLAQLRVPDARRRGGTMRYWEAQYDVQMLPNMFNSPHGWSGWRAYATYYAYLLTGEERWLTETFNAACAFSNLIDYRTGDLRWAFVVDPYLRVTQACSADSHVTADSLSFGNPHPELYDTRSFVIGEQYVNMISDWQTVNTQDNDVHEVFKFIGEALLTNAFIIEHPDGSVTGYNCTVSRHGDTLRVTPAEKQITRLHCNLSGPWTVVFPGSDTAQLPAGYLGWLP